MIVMQQISNPYIISQVLSSFYEPDFYFSEYLHHTIICFGEFEVKFRNENPFQYKISKLKEN